VVSKLGVYKIRFTGGEPLLRKDIPELVNYTKNLPGVESVHLTTNGILLHEYIDDLADAGLSGINISLDTLQPDRFQSITRRSGLNQVIENIHLAITSQIPSVKINVVAMRDFNHDELVDFANLTMDNNITVRFIELMPFDSRQIWKTGKFYRAEHIVEDLHSQTDQLQSVDGSSTEHYIFRMKDAKGKIAVIPAFSRNLCGACNRIRITADGKLLNCLYSQDETNLRDAMRDGASNEKIQSMIGASFLNKHVDGWSAQQNNGVHRESMTQIGG
jgi:cyclic pyranopterin phosphate synthase